MVTTLGQANASVSTIKNLLNSQQTLSPEYSIDWNQVLVLIRTSLTGPQHLLQHTVSSPDAAFQLVLMQSV